MFIVNICRQPSRALAQEITPATLAHKYRKYISQAVDLYVAIDTRLSQYHSAFLHKGVQMGTNTIHRKRLVEHRNSQLTNQEHFWGKIIQ